MAKDTVFSNKSTLNISGNLLSLEKPVVMGILNITPDSFFDGGKHNDISEALKQAEQMINDGAEIIDIGGYSSRPDAIDISVSEEISRVTPVIEALKAQHPNLAISIDTFRSDVAAAAVKAGANIINDISGGDLDDKMYDTVADLDVPYILMHMRGTPQTMKTKTSYDNLLLEILDFFQKKVSNLRKRSVKDIVLDPGFGFAKTPDQNYVLLKNLQYFKSLGLPLLVGVSRKSMIYKKLEVDATQALNGTTVLNTIALMNGARILRVHDVKEAVEAVKLFNLTYN
ncbi:dihydropteroate synthase [Fulvivirga ligni]|uniref:dihydropteroate synthase n=1 Tax=Fulvivirga ligni TaxID=2904246 RepID=UPI001F30E2CD|nr:dihydropteroate synthase [Fulvivirga ligni]UII21762.1 dihydropteroate synthase [Fulvivirga ligni]